MLELTSIFKQMKADIVDSWLLYLKDLSEENSVFIGISEKEMEHLANMALEAVFEDIQLVFGDYIDYEKQIYHH